MSYRHQPSHILSIPPNIRSIPSLVLRYGGAEFCRPERANMTERATRSSPWRFDPVKLGRGECDAWAAYYRHEWPQFLTAAVGLVSTGSGMNRRCTLIGAWHVLRANQAWAPYPVNDPAAARAHMQRFYTLVADSGSLALDPVRASHLEVAWWGVHRERQHNDAIAGDQLTDALNALYSYAYDAPAELTRPASALRVKAMDLSDQWVEAGCDRADPLLAEERRTLVASYATLLDATARQSRAA
jgi:hypothetical protein